MSTQASGTQQAKQPFEFLSLAPATSDSYPTAPKTNALASIGFESTTKRRSSSQSSAGGLRFLKLGPVHYGEHQDNDKSDWHDVAVE